MDKQFSVALLILSELFSTRFKFDLPWYQRAYAWTADHAKCPYCDVRDAMSAGEQWYHLGLVVLAKPGSGSETKIVDGQQRIVTLTILFAVLRDLIDDAELRALLNERIWVGTGDSEPHLKPQDTIADCLLKYVQNDGATKIEPDDEAVGGLNCNEQNVIDNRNALREMLADVGCEELGRIARFLIENCHVVVEELADEELAVQLYVKSQLSGMELSSTDMFKANVLKFIAWEHRDSYAWIWDQAVADLGNARFLRLLEGLRDIKVRARPRRPVEVDLIKHYSITADARAFMDNVLGPAADLAIAVKNFNVGDGGRAADNAAHAAINRRLQYLSWVLHDTWRAPALHWLMVHGLDDTSTLEFFQRLEAFSFMHMLASTDTYSRQRDYYAVLAGIENRAVLSDDGPLRVTKANTRRARKRLMENNFGKGGHNNKIPILLRIDATFHGDQEVVELPHATVEHVLPINPKEGSHWEVVFPDSATRAAYRQRLGNLVPLTPEENNAADNDDFSIKEKVYRSSKFILARDLLFHKHWNPKTIEKRTAWMIDRLFKAWRLR